uniref:peptidoglycan-binding domain-containing protein n=1 Tax=Salinispora cortesiana TaxID=1305843 RepID=UPI000472C652
LPSGYYFGSRSGGNRSVSGYYRRKFNGKTDRQWLATWTTQLVRRGWPAGKGRRYLRMAGNDGLYGQEYRELIKAFQADQGLRVDGLLGRKTWDAAYRNPIT